MLKRLLLLLAVVSTFSIAAPLDWSKAEKVQQGVRLIRMTVTEPRLMKIYVMRVDLSMKGIGFWGLERVKEFGQPMPDAPKNIIRTIRTTVPKFMTDLRNRKEKPLNMIVGFNTSPWAPWPPPKGNTFADPVYLVISNGDVITEGTPSGNKAVYVIWRNGKHEIVREVPKERFKDVWIAHSGFGILMKDGKALPDTGYEAPLMPRMSMGLDKDRHYMYLVAIDGRQDKVSLGAKGVDVNKIMTDAGVWDAIDFDGGGSATLCYWDKKTNKPVVVTHQPGGYVRPCGMVMGIFLRDKKAK